jgi:hypothetical protein
MTEPEAFACWRLSFPEDREEGTQRMGTLVTYNVWSVALALTRGVPIIRTIPGRWTAFELDDSTGQASQALDDWRHGRATVSARDFVEAYRDVQRMAHA